MSQNEGMKVDAMNSVNHRFETGPALYMHVGCSGHGPAILGHADAENLSAATRTGRRHRRSVRFFKANGFLDAIHIFFIQDATHNFYLLS
jgi:hypothetical protein